MGKEANVYMCKNIKTQTTNYKGDMKDEEWLDCLKK